jgi:ferric-dicitrate binding protein FerR (iron transport regulator)
VEHNDESNTSSRHDGKDPIERLLKLAGSRPQPDAERKAEFKKHLHAEWHSVTAPATQRRTFQWTAAVLVAAAAVFLVVWPPLWRITPDVPVSNVVGRVVRSEGLVRSLPTGTASAPAQPVTVGDEIRTDTLIDTTAGGRVAVALDDGASLRVDVGTRMVMLRERVVRLDQGAVYVDSRLDRNRPILVQTQNGEVRDIGTQFEVRAGSSTLLVRVREGEVIVDRRGSSISARAGELLSIDPQGRPARSAAPVFGPEWEWVAAIAPQFRLEGSTVQQFLDWVGREQGWRWRFADADTARRAAGIVTHGSVEGYTPEEALAIVLPTCGLSFVRNRDEVIVSLQKEPSPRGQ